jgi:hypothetical protein
MVDQVAAGRPGPQSLGHAPLGHAAGAAPAAELVGGPVGSACQRRSCSGVGR